MVSEISEESSNKFHEKWVLQYGHASVAEHAVLHIAAEGVSRLSVESLEEKPPRLLHGKVHPLPEAREGKHPSSQGNRGHRFGNQVFPSP